MSDNNGNAQMYYCLDTSGDLRSLGKHGDYESANDAAERLGVDVIWLIDEIEAYNWRNVLNNEELGQ